MDATPQSPSTVTGVHHLDGFTYKDAIRSQIPLPCESCGVDAGRNRCAKCLSVSYCKKECQVEHWKFHKQDCARAQEALYLESLVIALYSSPVILHLLRVLLALKVGLPDRPLPLGECHTAFIHVHINPCDDDDKAAVATGFRVIPGNGKGPDANIKGYTTLRVSNAEPTATVHIELSGEHDDPVVSHSIPIENAQNRDSESNSTDVMRHTKSATRLWRQARRKADLDASSQGVSMSGNPVVLVDFIYFEDEYVVAVEIGAGDINAAKDRSVTPELADILQQAGISMPSGAWTPEAISISINDYINGDSGNRLKLRRHLKKSDGEYLVALLQAGTVA